MVDVALGAILGAFASLLVSVMFEESAAETVKRVGWEARNFGTDPSCEDPGWYQEVRPLRVAPGTVLYEGNRVNQWEGGHLMNDGFLHTAWLGRDGEPHEKRIGFSFAEEPRLAFACMVDGDVENVRTYFGNGRIAEYAITGCGEDFSESLPEAAGTVDNWITFEADREHQIDLNCATTSLALQIVSTHPQDRALLDHDGDTVSISEIRFYEIP